MASTTKFTEKAQEAILNAQRETESRNISQFEPIALLLAPRSIRRSRSRDAEEARRRSGCRAQDAATEFERLPKLSYAAQPSHTTPRAKFHTARGATKSI